MGLFCLHESQRQRWTPVITGMCGHVAHSRGTIKLWSCGSTCNLTINSGALHVMFPGLLNPTRNDTVQCTCSMHHHPLNGATRWQNDTAVSQPLCHRHSRWIFLFFFSKRNTATRFVCYKLTSLFLFQEFLHPHTPQNNKN